MKRYLKYIAALIICAAMLGGCAGEKQIDYSDTYVDGQDSQENLTAYQDIQRFAASDKSYYFITDDFDAPFIYEIDKKTQECHPLCNKSDCLHDKEKDYNKMTQCGAYIKFPVEKTLVYYDGYLYYAIDYSYQDEDGVWHEQEKICKRDVKSSTTQIIHTEDEVSFFSIKLHRGYFYIDMTSWEYEGEVESREATADPDKSVIYKLPIDGKGKMKKAVNLNKFRKLYPGMFIWGDRYYGNHLFLQIEYIINEKLIQTIINYNLQTNEWMDIGDNLDVEIETPFTVFNDKLIFGNGTKIYECDFDGTNQREILDGSKFIKGYISFKPYCNDGENLFVSGSSSYKDKSQNIIVCDKNYNPTVQKLPIKFPLYVGFDETAFIRFDENKGLLYWIDKSDYTSKLIYAFPTSKKE